MKILPKRFLILKFKREKTLNETSIKEIIHLIKCLDDNPVEFEWLLNTTEKWCRDRAIYLALVESIGIARWAR